MHHYLCGHSIPAENGSESVNGLGRCGVFRSGISTSGHFEWASTIVVDLTLNYTIGQGTFVLGMVQQNLHGFSAKVRLAIPRGVVIPCRLHSVEVDKQDSSWLGAQSLPTL